ncbi:Mitochondria protein Fmp29 [Penicillium vulpinum]|uniref:Mitochondria protein Fmp29 n=1 Tax=Penicillium vulpinum TaxID=29845 RepID=UPI0025487E18|nr:Mitochondria protein Fmp29 [Penicillium vulpinum]KAJ5950693.1 Mitochondria protein Fmp29 [Penicillium vulpinum]
MQDSSSLEVYHPFPVSAKSSLPCLFPPAITYLPVQKDSARNSFRIHDDDGSRFNETDRSNERYVKFRPTELQKIAGEALQQDYCSDIAKFAEGGFNKVFLLRAKNGCEVIARIPTPVAGPPYYTTASEVATMNFLRAVLKLPVPEVLVYSISSDNPVGAEYILIERVEGESLSSRWLSLTTGEVKDIITQIADIERKIFDFYFPAYRSLYYKKDLNEDIQIPIVEDFCIGPVSPRQFWYNERSKTEIDRLSTVDCITSAARREIAVIQYHAKAQPRSYSAPTLRYPDLSLSNILLAPGSTKIISYPAFCEHDYSRPQSLYILSLPDDFDKIVCPIVFSDEERKTAIAESQEWNESEQLLSRVRENLDIDPEGGTEPENFERAVEVNRQFRMEMVRQAEVGEEELSWRNWPYKDDEDDSMPPGDI